MEQFRCRAQCCGLYVGVANDIVRRFLVLINLNLKQASFSIESVTLDQLIGPLEGQILSLGTNDSTNGFHGVIANGIARVAGITIQSSTCVEQVGPKVVCQSRIALGGFGAVHKMVGHFLIRVKITLGATTEVVCNQWMYGKSSVFVCRDIKQSHTHEFKTVGPIESQLGKEAGGGR